MSIRTVKLRPFDRVEVTDDPIFGNSGLAGIGQLIRIAVLDPVRSSRSLPNYKISDTDILKVFCGMVAIGKVGFDHIHHFDNDKNFFADALRIGKRSQGSRH